MANVQLLSGLDVSQIAFSGPPSEYGRTTIVPMNYNQQQMPLVQTWLGRVAFDGISAFQDTGRIQYSLELSFAGSETIEPIAGARRAVEGFDEFLVQSAVKNSHAWFKKKLELAFCKECYTSWMRMPKGDETGEETDQWPPTIKLKLPTNEDDSDFRFAIYDMKTRERVATPANLLDYVPKRASVRAILKCGGVWIANGRFGCSWYVEQLQRLLPEDLCAESTPKPPKPPKSAPKPTAATEIPPDFCDPILLDVLVDPVKTAMGQVYERASIEQWLAAGNTTDPLTNTPMMDLTLTPQPDLVAEIAAFRAANPSFQ